MAAPAGENSMSLGTVQFLTIHCAATPEGRNDSAEKIEQMDIQRFKQKSYHIIVELDGTIHRSLTDDQLGAHVGGHNHHNVGVCYVGGMDAGMLRPKDTRTEMQKRALLSVVKDYMSRYPGIVVRGHREWPGVAKACPSFDVRAWLKQEGVL
jgi:N-acetyl-anhydromuramyl-L-alanine amidase AmpD